MATKAARVLLFALQLLLFVAPARSSRISFFTDEDCSDFLYNVTGPNGYPDGDCRPLKQDEAFGSFRVVDLDRGCDVALYTADTPQGICSPGGSIVAVPRRCYSNPTWTYYSIDTCRREETTTALSTNSSTSSPSSTPSTSSQSSSTSSGFPSTIPTTADQAPIPDTTSESNTGAIAGGVVGGVAGLAIIGGMAWFTFRKKRKQGDSGEAPERPEREPGEPGAELSAQAAPMRSELAVQRSHSEADSKPAPQELDAGVEREQRASWKEEKGPVL